eukprot:Skav201576  [mRNA]  locus=scaffold152:122003:126185:+ [translate_table: standard]
MLVLGGNSKSEFLSDLQLYHPNTYEWQELKPTGSGPGAGWTGTNYVPPGRSGHSAVWVDGLGMLVFGGSTCDMECYNPCIDCPHYFNNLHLYLPGTNEWQELSPKGSLPRSRSGHSAVWIDRLKGMLIFGGWACDDASDAETCRESNDLHLYLSETNEWQELSPNSTANGTVPKARSHHSAVWIDGLNGMVIFGGEFAPTWNSVDYDCEYFSDMHLYLPETNEWQELRSNHWVDRDKRSSHSATWDESLNRMLVVGGYECKTRACRTLQDWHSYDPETNMWEDLGYISWDFRNLGRGGHSIVWVDGLDSGAYGMLLYGGFSRGHSAVWIDRLKGMLVFGGWTCGPGWWDYWDNHCWELNDLHLYLPETNEWQELSPYSTANGTVPKTRSHHSAVWIDGLNGMVIFGGEHCPDRGFTVWNCETLWDMHLYVPETNEWQELQNLDNFYAHPGYQAHSALWVEALNRMVVTGGYLCYSRGYRDGYSCGHWDSIHFYYPENNTWEEVWSSADSPLLSRAGHSTVWLDGVDSGANGTLMFGGFSIEGDGRDFTWHFLNDLRLYDSVVDLDAGYDANAGRVGVAVPGVVASLLLSMYLL